MKTEKEIKELLNIYEGRNVNEGLTMEGLEFNALISWIKALTWVLEDSEDKSQ